MEASADTETDRPADDIVIIHDLRDRAHPVYDAGSRRGRAEFRFADDPFVVDWAPPRS
ncbi:MAG: hypothetical protein ABI658_12885 [Acidimicrobiales bacterium]